MTTQKEEHLDNILSAVEEEWKMGGLSDGLYADYAKEVCRRLLTELMEWEESRKKRGNIGTPGTHWNAAKDDTLTHLHSLKK